MLGGECDDIRVKQRQLATRAIVETRITWHHHDNDAHNLTASFRNIP